jgi:mono/diheme cytochrome c family protein
VFDKYCAACHTKTGDKRSPKALDHFDMSTYPFGGHHAHEIAETIRASIGAAGKPATMPKGAAGSVKGDELAAVVAWADAYKAHQGNDVSKPGHDHGHDHGHSH